MLCYLAHHSRLLRHRPFWSRLHFLFDMRADLLKVVFANEARPCFVDHISGTILGTAHRKCMLAQFCDLSKILQREMLVAKSR